MQHVHLLTSVNVIQGYKACDENADCISECIDTCMSVAPHLVEHGQWRLAGQYKRGKEWGWSAEDRFKCRNKITCYGLFAADVWRLLRRMDNSPIAPPEKVPINKY